ncbi:MAG: divalent-cation tolerance protein CutA [Alphaproteobacteria bacterium]
MAESKAARTECFFLYVTAASREEAVHLARTLVEERLAACANVIGPVHSFYWWGGKVEDAAEAVLVAKTQGPRVEAAIRRVKELHSYTCPCIVAWPLAAGNPAFLDWIVDETGGG